MQRQLDPLSVWTGHYTPLGAFAVLIALILCASTSLFRGADAPTGSTREENAIDGLRGLLALAVFFQHATVYRRYMQDGVWSLPPSPFYTLCGHLGVAIFFMITAYLFFGRVLARAADWRTREWIELYIGRVFRIGPLYLAAIVPVIAMALILGLGEPVGLLAKHIAQWLALGALGAPTVNGYADTNVTIAGVTWSLAFEWAFYAALPMLALLRFAPRTLVALAFVGLLGLVAVHGGGKSLTSCFALFAGGMLVAVLPPARLPQSLSSALAALAIGVAFATNQNGYTAGAIALSTAAFYLIASGASIFGLLTMRAAHRLGNISYGIYLLQGTVLMATFSLPGVRSFALQGAPAYWLVVAIAALGLSVLAMAAHRYIEQPGIALGRSLTKRTQRVPAVAI